MRSAAKPEAVETQVHPNPSIPVEKLPGHWLLASLGKKVPRPGGLELTKDLLRQLRIGPLDDVLELAPGLGVTARLTLARQPRSYTAVERDERAARRISDCSMSVRDVVFRAVPKARGRPEPQPPRRWRSGGAATTR